MRFPLIPAFLSGLLIAACLAAGAWMTEGSLLKAYRSILESRFAIALDRAAEGATHAASLGVSLDSQEETLGAALRRELVLEPDILGMAVQDARGRRLYGEGPVPDPSPPGVLRRALLDDLGLPIGQILLRYDPRALESPSAEIRRDMRGHAVPVVAGVALLGFLAALALRAGRVVDPAQGESTRRRVPLALALALILGGGLFLINHQALRIIDRTLGPLIETKVESIGHGARALIGKALDLGIPLDQMWGVPEYFASLRRHYPELKRIMLDTSPAAVSGATAPGRLILPVPAQGPVAAALVVTPDSRYVAAQVQSLLLDTAFLGLVALLVGFELLSLLMRVGVFQRPLPIPAACGAAPSPVEQIRGALFFFTIAEGLNYPFLPSLTERLLPPGLSHTLLFVSLPLVVFMGISALGQIPLAVWSESLGRRRGLAVGIAVAGIGYGLNAFVETYSGLLLARALSGVGVTLVFISAQGHIIDQYDHGTRTAGFAGYLRTVMVAGLCAPPIGGFWAEHFGVAPAFLTAAGLCLTSLCLVWAMMPAVPPCAQPHTVPRLVYEVIGETWRIPGLRTLLLGCAVPAKLILSALCSFLVPIILVDEGHSLASIGRVQMIHPLMMIMFVPLFARWGETFGRDPGSGKIALGGLIAGIGVIPIMLWPGLGAIVAFLVLLGLGQSLSSASQSSLVAAYTHREQGQHSAQIRGLFRLVERSGSAIGPMLAGGLLSLFGLAPTLALFSLLATGGALYYGREQWAPRPRTIPHESFGDRP
ncbi:MFS transporter [Castellaniella sp. WN]